MASIVENPELRNNLLVLLRRTRDVYGYVPDHALTALADELGIPLVEAYAVATFYRALPTRPMGKHVIRLCKSVPCYLKHNRAIIDAVQTGLGIGPRETTRDGLFTLELVNCIGACDRAPAMMIDDDVFGLLSPDSVGEILTGYQ